VRPASPGAFVRFRVALPVTDLERSRAFYADLLGLPVEGGFAGHDGYDGVILALPGGGQLELTVGGPPPAARTDDDLLVLYLATEEEVAATVAALTEAGVARVPSGNPNWDRWGATVLDPDGARVVLARVPS